MKLTQKQETFCLNILKGMGQREAYKEAGYSTNMSLSVIDVKASELAKNGKVSVRIKELRQIELDATIATVVERKQILTNILRVTPSDVIEISEDERDTRIKPEALKSPAVSYIRTEQVALGKMPVRVTRVGLTDKVRAAAELNKMERIYDTEGTVKIDNRTLNIYVNSEKAKDLTQRLIEGERTE